MNCIKKDVNFLIFAKMLDMYGVMSKFKMNLQMDF